MLKIAVKSKYNPQQVLAKAIKYFGEEGYRLKIVNQTEDSVNFEGGGGLVDVKVSEAEGKTEVELFTREWEYQLKEFIDTIR